jgi:ADP-ribose pyrophosphatase YjhB (NUDIX family)
MGQTENNEILFTLYAIADDLQAIANLGLMYCENDYDKERYEKVLTTSNQIIRALEGNVPETDKTGFYDTRGRITPQIGVEAAVFRNGRLLLIKRHDIGLWAVPGGMVEVGETLTNAALRELREETGLIGKVTGLLGVFDSRIWKSRLKAHLYHVIFRVDAADVDPVITKEATDWGFFPADNLPELSPGHVQRVPLLFKLVKGEIEYPYFDAPDKLPH